MVHRWLKTSGGTIRYQPTRASAATWRAFMVRLYSGTWAGKRSLTRSSLPRAFHGPSEVRAGDRRWDTPLVLISRRGPAPPTLARGKFGVFALHG